MAFEIVAGQSRTAIDPAKSSRMTIRGRPQIEFMEVTFSSPDFSLSMPLIISSNSPTDLLSQTILQIPVLCYYPAI